MLIAVSQFFPSAYLAHWHLCTPMTANSDDTVSEQNGPQTRQGPGRQAHSNKVFQLENHKELVSWLHHRHKGGSRAEVGSRMHTRAEMTGPIFLPISSGVVV